MNLLLEINKAIDKYKANTNRNPLEFRVSVDYYKKLVKENFPNTKDSELLITPFIYNGVNITWGIEDKNVEYMECPFKQDCKNCSYHDPKKLKSKHGCTFVKWWLGEIEPKFKSDIIYKMKCFRCKEDMTYIEDKETEILGWICMDCPNGCGNGYLVPKDNPSLIKSNL